MWKAWRACFDAEECLLTWWCVALAKSDFFVSPMPDDWDEGEMRQGPSVELAEEFADGLLICSVMES